MPTGLWSRESPGTARARPKLPPCLPSFPFGSNGMNDDSGKGKEGSEMSTLLGFPLQRENFKAEGGRWEEPRGSGPGCGQPWAAVGSCGQLCAPQPACGGGASPSRGRGMSTPPRIPPSLVILFKSPRKSYIRRKPTAPGERRNILLRLLRTKRIQRQSCTHKRQSPVRGNRHTPGACNLCAFRKPAQKVCLLSPRGPGGLLFPDAREMPVRGAGLRCWMTDASDRRRAALGSD